MRRTAFGTAGRPIAITTNHFPVTIPDSTIHHYDGGLPFSHSIAVPNFSLAVIIRPDEKTLLARLNMQIIDRLQTKFAPQVFTPRAVYDGRKNLFAARELPFGESRTQEVRGYIMLPHLSTDLLALQFDVTLEDAGASATSRAPKIYKVKLTHVAEINSEYV